MPEDIEVFTVTVLLAVNTSRYLTIVGVLGDNLYLLHYKISTVRQTVRFKFMNKEIMKRLILLFFISAILPSKAFSQAEIDHDEHYQAIDDQVYIAKQLIKLEFNYTQGIDQLEKALTLAKKIDDNKGIRSQVNILFDLAQSHHKLGYFEKAQDLYLQGFNLGNRKLSGAWLSDHLAYTTKEIADFYRHHKKYDLAEIYFEKFTQNEIDIIADESFNDRQQCLHSMLVVPMFREAKLWSRAADAIDKCRDDKYKNTFTASSAHLTALNGDVQKAESLITRYIEELKGDEHRKHDISLGDAYLAYSAILSIKGEHKAALEVTNMAVLKTMNYASAHKNMIRRLWLNQADNYVRATHYKRANKIYSTYFSKFAKRYGPSSSQVYEVLLRMKPAFEKVSPYKGYNIENREQSLQYIENEISRFESLTLAELERISYCRRKSVTCKDT